MHNVRKRILLRPFASRAAAPFGMDKSAKIQAAISSVPDFKGYQESDFTVEPLKGGLTNLLWTVRLDSSNHETTKSTKKTKTAPATVALIREYGRGTESFMNRKQEEAVVKNLSDRGLCPKVFGAFPWGRVELFLDDAKTLSTKEYGSLENIGKVAELLGKFHHESPTMLSLCSSTGAKSALRDRMESWYSIASKVSFPADDAESKRKQRKLIALDLPNTIRKEIDWMLDEIDAIKSPIVFCHCDLQEGNLLLHNDKLSMIDFEYSDKLERGFDLGNCFCEMAINYGISHYPGFVLNPDDMPNEEKQLCFVEAYARGSKIEMNDANRRQLLKEANVFVMGSHLHWAVWSVVQAGSSTIEFGYLEFAEQRMDQYYYLKRQWQDLSKRIDSM